MAVRGAQLTGKGRRFSIGGADPMAHNDPSDPGRVDVDEDAAEEYGRDVEARPCSVTLWVLEVAR